jgi:ABC-2 type transport system permease protein
VIVGDDGQLDPIAGAELSEQSGHIGLDGGVAATVYPWIAAGAWVVFAAWAFTAAALAVTTVCRRDL